MSRKKKKVTVIDAMMGKGKTTWSIGFINDHPDVRVLYITPFREEFKRIIEGVTTKIMYTPEAEYDPKSQTCRKTKGFKELLKEGKDIVSTHKMFKCLDEESRTYIKENHYVLILDEVLSVVEPYNGPGSKKGSIEILKKANAISIDNRNFVHWNHKATLYQTDFEPLKRLADNNNLVCVDDTFFLWVYPPEIFKLFRRICILTYMFDASILKNYFKAFKIEYTLKSLDDNNRICEYEPADLTQYKPLINIYDGTLNNYMSKKYALSVNDYKKMSKDDRRKMKNNISNYQKNITHSSSEDFMWTTFKEYRKDLQSKGNIGNDKEPKERVFLPFNARSTNDYEHKHNLAYAVNLFLNPSIVKFFEKFNIKIDEDKWALSEMIQWIWRSAIRKKDHPEPINIYIPAKRMRDLFIKWLDDNSNEEFLDVAS